MPSPEDLVTQGYDAGGNIITQGLSVPGVASGPSTSSPLSGSGAAADDAALAALPTVTVYVQLEWPPAIAYRNTLYVVPVYLATAVPLPIYTTLQLEGFVI